MNTKVLLGAAGLAGGAIALGQLSAFPDQASRHATETEIGAGEAEYSAIGGSPDVVVWRLYDTLNAESGDYRAYAIGTISCNIGDTPLSWISFTNQHPVIAQNMFRYKDGRLTQIGQAWLKHGFFALDEFECGACQATGGSSLGVGCSDPYSAFLNGQQSNLGPKYEVDATTGEFPYPPADPPYSGVIDRRLKVLKTDVEAVHNPDARWFVEGTYIHPEDSAEDGDASANNASYGEVQLAANGALTGYIGPTEKYLPGIHAWKAVDPEVAFTHVPIPGEGNLFVAHRVFDNGDGTWRYEYAVQNLDFDRSAGGFTVAVPSGVDVTDIGFHDVDYHSGEPWHGTDWTSTRSGDELSWVTEPYDDNSKANAIRWGTMYNFWFTADAGPVDGDVVIDVFKPGSPDSFQVPAISVPGGGPSCPDVDGDDAVGFTDLLAVLGAWGACPGCDEDVDGDDVVGFSDVLLILSFWGPCP